MFQRMIDRLGFLLSVVDAVGVREAEVIQMEVGLCISWQPFCCLMDLSSGGIDAFNSRKFRRQRWRLGRSMDEDESGLWT